MEKGFYKGKNEIEQFLLHFPYDLCKNVSISSIKMWKIREVTLICKRGFSFYYAEFNFCWVCKKHSKMTAEPYGITIFFLSISLFDLTPSPLKICWNKENEEKRRNFYIIYILIDECNIYFWLNTWILFLFG